MATRKRSRTSPETPTSNKKRARGTGHLSRRHKHGAVDPRRQYKIKSIIDENDTHYHISWADDEVTGQAYETTWEPKKNANRLAVEDWLRQKAERDYRSRNTSTDESPARAPSTLAPASPPNRTISRRRQRVVESSSPSQAAHQPNGHRDTTLQQTEQVLEVGESQPSTPQDLEPSHPGRENPALAPTRLVSTVQPSPPTSSFLAGEYQRILPDPTSVDSTQHYTSPHPSQYPRVEGPDTADTVDASAGIAATPFKQAKQPLPLLFFTQSATRVVPDSQALSTSAPPYPATAFEPRQKAIDTPSPEQSISASNGVILPTSSPQPRLGAGTEEASLSVARDKSLGNERTDPVHARTSVRKANSTVSDEDSAINNREIRNSTAFNLATGSTSLQESGSDSQGKWPSRHSASFHDADSAAASRINLISTQRHTPSPSRFSVTPPQLKTRADEAYQPYSTRNPPSETWQSSSFLQPEASVPDHSGRPHDHFSVIGRADVAPLVESRPPPATFSPITAIPSQSVGPFRPAYSRPAHPPSFSGPSSPTNTSPQSTPRSAMGDQLREQLKAMRAQAKAARESQLSGSASLATPEQAPRIQAAVPVGEAKLLTRPRLASPLVFAREAARSPSAVPAEEPLPAITLEEMTTSARYETLLPQSHGESNEVPQASTLTKTKSPEKQPEHKAQSARAVPVYFVGHQRDQYVETVYFCKETVQRYLATKHPDDTLIQETKDFVQRLRHITLHPDLGNAETYTQYDVEPRQQADWDARCSAKFRFLRDLFGQLEGSKLRVAIVAKPGRLIDILETFLQGIKVRYERNATSSDPPEEGIIALLLESGLTTKGIPSVDLVIDVDNSIDHDTEQFRDVQRNGQTPYISLVVPRSLEHVERCLSVHLPDAAHLRALVNGIYQYRDEAGRSSGLESPRPSESNAVLLAEYFKADGKQDWPLPALHNLNDLDSQTDSDWEDANANVVRSTGEKRSREPEDLDLDGKLSSKRSRVEPPASGTPPAPQPFEGDTTHISDSIQKTMQESPPVLTATEARLQKLLIAAQDRLDEHVKVLSDLQFRYEDQRTKLHEVTNERDQATATAQLAVTRLSEESNKMSNLRADHSKAKEQLQEANTRLLDHTVPARAEFEALRLSVEQITAERVKAEKRFEQANKDLAYVRNLYQNASNSAHASVTQVAELEGQLAVAESKATGEHAKLRQMGLDEFTKHVQDENKRLKVLLSERESALKCRDEEISKLKEASRGRMGTRGTSLPRSPRLGSPKPGSRQASPNMGDIRARPVTLHPLRNG